MERRDSEDNELVIDEDVSTIDDILPSTHEMVTENTIDTITIDLIEEDGSLENLLEPLPIPPKGPPKVKVTSKTKKAAMIPKNPRPFKRVQQFKLNTLKNFKNSSLSVSAKLHEFYNMRLYVMPGSILSAEVAADDPAPSSMPEMPLEQLINWPGVAITLTLRDITYTRKTVANYGRDIVFGTDNSINMDTIENNCGTRQISQTSSSRSGPQISKLIFDQYIGAFEDCFELIDVSRSRITEMEAVINKMKDDLKVLPNLVSKTTFSRFPNKYKYVRLFNHEKSMATNKTRKMPNVFIRETINPEIQFAVEKCTFLNETFSVWENDFRKYFEMVFTVRDRTTLAAIKEVAKRCISMTCLLCNSQFSGVLCVYALKAHLAKHFHNEDWSCTNCHTTFSQFDLIQTDWVHECIAVERNGVKNK